MCHGCVVLACPVLGRVVLFCVLCCVGHPILASDRMWLVFGAVWSESSLAFGAYLQPTRLVFLTIYRWSVHALSQLFRQSQGLSASTHFARFSFTFHLWPGFLTGDSLWYTIVRGNNNSFWTKQHSRKQWTCFQCQPGLTRVVHHRQGQRNHLVSPGQSLGFLFHVCIIVIVQRQLELLCA